MTNQALILFIFIVSFIAANLPWLSDKAFLVKTVTAKSGWLRWIEWFLLYMLSLAIGIAIENKTMGTISAQDWEFYVVTLCLFVVFALPGFIYCYDLKRLFKNSAPKG